jgi:hypothetical protein
LAIEFTGHLQLVTTSNYSRFTNSHTLQFSTVRARSTFSRGVAKQRLSTMGIPPPPTPPPGGDSLTETSDSESLGLPAE